MKKLLLLAVAVFAGSAMLGSVALGRVLAGAIETAGSAALGVPVSVGLVTLSPLSGRGTVRRLVVGNPPGFSGPYAFKADAIEVTVRPASLFGDAVVVESVVVRAPSVRVEGDNLARLKAKASSGGGDGGGRSVRIKRLEVLDGSVALPGGLTAPLPDIRLKEVGGRSALQQVLGSLSARGLGSSALDGVGGLLKKLR
ncbi:MAG: hypothetical protein SF051_15760 [Elusimicrobiota bacterium]|nr:hypothetical protein [Elusimicrobiota bacterium]